MISLLLEYFEKNKKGKTLNILVKILKLLFFSFSTYLEHLIVIL